MTLLRKLIIATMTYNIQIQARYVTGRSNTLADAISRSRIDEFDHNAPWADSMPTQIPPDLLPENLIFD